MSRLMEHAASVLKNLHQMELTVSALLDYSLLTTLVSLVPETQSMTVLLKYVVARIDSGVI